MYRVGDRWEVVDWKTNIAATADPLQLAIYRHAWSQSMNVPATDIDGCLSTFVLRRWCGSATCRISQKSAFRTRPTRVEIDIHADRAVITDR